MCKDLRLLILALDVVINHLRIEINKCKLHFTKKFKIWVDKRKIIYYICSHKENDWFVKSICRLKDLENVKIKFTKKLRKCLDKQKMFYYLCETRMIENHLSKLKLWIL